MAVLQPLEFPSGDVAFHKTFVDHMKQAISCVFDIICIETFVPHYTDIRFDNLRNEV